MSFLGLNENETRENQAGQAEDEPQKSNSIVLWIIGIIVIGFLGRLVGRPLGELAAYGENSSRMVFPIKSVIVGIIALGILIAVFYYSRSKK